MVSTQSSLESLLDALAPAQPRHSDNLLFVPLVLRDGAPEHPGTYVPIAEALSTGQVTVTETQEVPTLHVENTGNRPVFAPAGTYLRGGGQDRILLVSVVLDAHAQGEIPVHCVEQSRWNAPAGTHFYSPDRGTIAGSSIVTGSSVADQQATWTTVRDFAQETRTDAPTGRHGDAYEQSAESLTPLQEAVILDGIAGRVVGAVFFVRYPDSGVHWALDVFGRSDLLRTYFPALRDSAALTALAARSGHPRQDYGLDRVSATAHEFLFRDLCEVPLATEAIPVMRRATLKTGHTKAGARVAILEDLDRPLHVLLRWNAK